MLWPLYRSLREYVTESIPTLLHSQPSSRFPARTIHTIQRRTVCSEGYEDYLENRGWIIVSIYRWGLLGKRSDEALALLCGYIRDGNYDKQCLENENISRIQYILMYTLRSFMLIFCKTVQPLRSQLPSYRKRSQARHQTEAFKRTQTKIHWWSNSFGV